LDEEIILNVPGTKVHALQRKPNSQTPSPTKPRRASSLAAEYSEEVMNE
jgi:hypothetical protein